MENKKGFTLVELLAVIVILAIIMIIAIPSVLTTMTSSKQKSFLEYSQKIYLTGMEKYTIDKNIGSLSTTTEETSYIYDITKDLGLSSTGTYKGVFVVYRCTRKSACPHREVEKIYLVNEDYYGYFVAKDGKFEPTGDDVLDVSTLYETISKEQLDSLDKKGYAMAFMSGTKCNTLQHNIYDAVTNELLVSNPAHPDAWVGQTCVEDYDAYIEEKKNED